jgi:hypothetical protein
MIGRLAEERPDCKAVCFHWPAWGEFGMAARPESRSELERRGLSFMSPQEGVSHFAAELAAEGSDHEVLVMNEPGLIDTDGIMSRQETPVPPAAFRQPFVASVPVAAASAAPAPVLSPGRVSSDPARLVQDLRAGSTPDLAYADLVLDSSRDPFLIYHTLRGKSILPGVITMQAMAEAAQLLRPNDHFIGFSNVSLGSGLSINSGNVLLATVRMKETAAGVSCELLAPFVNSRGEVVDPRRCYASAIVEFGSPPQLPPVPAREPLFGWNQFRYPTTSLIQHGPPLQTFMSLAYRHGNGLALIDGRDPSQLLGERLLTGVALPSAEFDGCLVACGFFVYAMVEQSINLPNGIKRCRFGRLAKPHEECKLNFTYQGRTEVGHRFDFVLAGAPGDVLLEALGYETVAVKE